MVGSGQICGSLLEVRVRLQGEYLAPSNRYSAFAHSSRLTPKVLVDLGKAFSVSCDLWRRRVEIYSGSRSMAPGRARRRPVPMLTGSKAVSAGAARALRTEPSVAAIHPEVCAAHPVSICRRYMAQRWEVRGPAVGDGDHSVS